MSKENVSQFLSPPELVNYFVQSGQKKASLSIPQQFLLGILAGAFIAFASEGSNAAIHTIASVGLGKALAGALFSTGLMLVIVAGGELFTGNTLMVVALIEKKIKTAAILRNWFFVYLGNLAGSLLIAFLIFKSGQLEFSDGQLGGFSLKLAAYKTNLTFVKAFSMGILCNWLVCLAVWMAGAATDIASKLLAIFFPIWLFITSGFEHSVANMYYISLGIMAKTKPLFVDSALQLGASQQSIDSINIATMLFHNLLPVTLGNIVGGSFFVGVIYWLVYKNQAKKM